MSAQVVVLDERVPMRDGVRLATDVTLVDDGAPKPAILTRTPYSRSGARASDDPIGLARDGWVHVNQDVRGRFDSEGRWLPFEHERNDGADAIAWCAAQPWCDGTVVGWGGSYLGTTQLLAAAARPPALKAIAPLITGARFDDRWTSEGGVLAIGFVLSWAANMAATDPRLTAKQRERAVCLVADPATLYGTPLARHPLRKLFPALDRWLDPTYRWPEAMRSMRQRSLPGFHVGGWFDIFGDASIDTYRAMVDGGAPQRLVVGPWTHAGVFQEFTPEMAFGLEANGLAGDVQGAAKRFLRAAAAGSVDDLETGVRVFVTGRNAWWELPSWPPPAEDVAMFLDTGTLRAAAPDAAQLSIEHDPRDPVPTHGGRLLQLTLPMAGPCDQRPVEARDDVLVFTGEAQGFPLTIAGEVRAAVQLTSTATSADVAVKVVDVHPDGRAMSVVDGIRRVTVPAGKRVRADVRVGSIAHELAPGHRLRVELAASNFPRFECNPHGGSHTFLLGGRYPSTVTIPVVNR